LQKEKHPVQLRRAQLLPNKADQEALQNLRSFNQPLLWDEPPRRVHNWI